jgi:hypothetical protein
VIDFRYHLVSLISVFLALAVGIALGAGPLKETIGDTLTGQVEQLRVERADLRTQLDVAQADQRRSEAALDALAPDLVADVLQERRVAIIEVDDVGSDALSAVVERLEQSGATVSATVQVTEAWTDPGRIAFRQSLAGSLVGYLEPELAADAGTGTELAEALAQGLTRAAPDDPDALDESAGISLELLQEGGLIVVEGTVTAPADAIVVLAGPTVSTVQAQEAEQELRTHSPEEVAQENERVDAVLGAAVQIATAAQLRSSGAVVAGGDLVEPSLVQRIRDDQELARTLSTVESVQRTHGQIAVPLALAGRIGGRVGHFGADESAEAVMPPRVVLPPVHRVEETPEVDPETGDGTGDGDAGTGDDGQGDPDGADGAGTEGADEADQGQG